MTPDSVCWACVDNLMVMFCLQMHIILVMKTLKIHPLGAHQLLT